jgi:hypothetical protein
MTTASGGCDASHGVLIAHCLGSDQPVAEPRSQRFNGTRQRLRFRTQIIGYGYAQTISSPT